MKLRSAIKTDLFADEQHRKKIDTLGDPLTEIGNRPSNPVVPGQR